MEGIVGSKRIQKFCKENNISMKFKDEEESQESFSPGEVFGKSPVVVVPTYNVNKIQIAVQMLPADVQKTIAKALRDSADKKRKEAISQQEEADKLEELVANIEGIN